MNKWIHEHVTLSELLMGKSGLYVLFLILQNSSSGNFSFSYQMIFKKQNHVPIVLPVADDQLNRYTAAVILISKHLSAQGFGTLH